MFNGIFITFLRWFALSTCTQIDVNLWVRKLTFRLSWPQPFKTGGMLNVTSAGKSYSKSYLPFAIKSSPNSSNEIIPLCLVVSLSEFLLT